MQLHPQKECENAISRRDSTITLKNCHFVVVAHSSHRRLSDYLAFSSNDKVILQYDFIQTQPTFEKLTELVEM